MAYSETGIVGVTMYEKYFKRFRCKPYNSEIIQGYLVKNFELDLAARSGDTSKENPKWNPDYARSMAVIRKYNNQKEQKTEPEAFYKKFFHQKLQKLLQKEYDDAVIFLQKHQNNTPWQKAIDAMNSSMIAVDTIVADTLDELINFEKAIYVADAPHLSDGPLICIDFPGKISPDEYISSALKDISKERYYRFKYQESAKRKQFALFNDGILRFVYRYHHKFIAVTVYDIKYGYTYRKESDPLYQEALMLFYDPLYLGEIFDYESYYGLSQQSVKDALIKLAQHNVTTKYLPADFLVFDFSLVKDYTRKSNPRMLTRVDYEMLKKAAPLSEDTYVEQTELISGVFDRAKNDKVIYTWGFAYDDKEEVLLENDIQKDIYTNLMDAGVPHKRYHGQKVICAASATKDVEAGLFGVYLKRNEFTDWDGNHLQFYEIFEEK